MRKASKMSKAKQSRRPSACKVFLKTPRTVVHRGADVALGTEVLAAVVLRKDGHSVSMGKDRKVTAVFEWARLTLKS
jgi:hypothetical protein